MTVSSTQSKYLLAYGIILGLVVVQAATAVYRMSLALHDRQRIAVLEQQKTSLAQSLAVQERQVARTLAIKPIQAELAHDYQPISSFWTAARHTTTAAR
jgi:hypothetical protein